MPFGKLLDGYRGAELCVTFVHLIYIDPNTGDQVRACAGRRILTGPGVYYFSAGRGSRRPNVSVYT